MSGSLLRVRGLARRFGSERALAGVDLDLEPGEVLALFGPNGAGKTTLLRILASLIRPTAGSVEIEGGVLCGPALRRRIGFVSHESFLYPQLTGLENLRFQGDLFEISGREERIREVLQTVGLSARAQDRVSVYSRGMVQRLTLARALLHDPRLLLFDEPWNGLDPEASAMLSALLRRQAEGGRGVVVTAHDFSQGLRVATRVAILHRGRIAWRADASGLDAAALEGAWRSASADGVVA